MDDVLRKMLISLSDTGNAADASETSMTFKLKGVDNYHYKISAIKGNMPK